MGTRAAYVSLVFADAASFAIAAVILLTLPAAPPARSLPGDLAESAAPGTGTAGSESSTRLAAAARPWPVLRDLRYVTVCVLNGLLMTYGAILTVGLPLWIVRRTHAPAWTVAGTFLVSTLLVVTLQVRTSRGTDTVPGAARAARKSGAGPDTDRYKPARARTHTAWPSMTRISPGASIGVLSRIAD